MDLIDSITMKYKNIGKKELAFFEKYINTYSPTGYETEGQKVWLDFVKDYIDTYEVDDYGTVVGIVNPEEKFKVVIEAHADEISWVVHHITDNGFIYVKRNGGMDPIIAPSMRVVLHTKKGLVPAVFGWPAIHTRGAGAKQEYPKAENVFIDAGCSSREEVEKLGIHIGCIATYQDEFLQLSEKVVTGRAMDNRVGGVLIALVAKRLKEEGVKLPFGLYVVNSVQEEIGLRGAQMIAHRIKPDCAFITDVGHDTNTPMINKFREGDFKMGKGPIVTYAPAVHNHMLDLVLDTAEEKKIPFQRDVATRGTGTDTDAFAYSNSGVPSALITIPLRYMHTTVETLSLEDLDNAVTLLAECLKKMSPDFNFKYLS